MTNEHELKPAPAFKAEAPPMHHPASSLLMEEARKESEDFTGKSAKETICDTILLLERRVGGVPPFIDIEAADYLEKAAERIEKGPFKEVLRVIETELNGWNKTSTAPLGARLAHHLTGYGGLLIANSGKRTSDNLRKLAKACREGEPGLSGRMYHHKLRRACEAVKFG